MISINSSSTIIREECYVEILHFDGHVVLNVRDEVNSDFIEMYITHLIVLFLIID